MSALARLPALRLADAPPPQNTLIIRLTLEAALDDAGLFATLITNPARAFQEAGYPIPDYQFEAFNQYLRDTIKFGDVLRHLAARKRLEDFVDIECLLCQIGVYSIAAIIAGIAAGGVAYLTAGSAPVIALAAFASVTAQSALVFINGIIATIVVGVTGVALAICQWINACPN